MKPKAIPSVMLTVSALTGSLAGRLRTQAQAARTREQRIAERVPPGVAQKRHIIRVHAFHDAR